MKVQREALGENLGDKKRTVDLAFGSLSDVADATYAKVVQTNGTANYEAMQNWENSKNV